MYTFLVTINEEASVIAGSDALQTLNAVLSCRLDPGAAARARLITLTVGGSTLPAPGVDGQRVRWLDERVLREGDVVTIALRDDVPPDAHSVHLPPATHEEGERFIFENCKRAYFALRAQYEVPQP